MSWQRIALTFAAVLSSITAVGVVVFLLFAALDAFTSPTMSLYKDEWTCTKERGANGPGVKRKSYFYIECLRWEKVK